MTDGRPDETIRFRVGGMTCGACVADIKMALRRLPGVAAVNVDLGAETVTLRRKPALATDAVLATTLAGVGYEADLAARLVLPPVDPPGLLDRFLGRSRS